MKLSYVERTAILREIRLLYPYLHRDSIGSRQRMIERDINKSLTRNKSKINHSEYLQLAREGMLASYNSSQGYSNWFSKLYKSKKRYDETRPIYFIHIGA